MKVEIFRQVRGFEMTCMYCGYPMNIAKGWEYAYMERGNYTCGCELFRRDAAISTRIKTLENKIRELEDKRPEEKFELLQSGILDGCLVIKKQDES